jgi:hypothetical protein
MRTHPLPAPLHAANEGLAFLLEVAMLGALAWWGFTTKWGVGLAVLLGVGAPLAAALAWGLFAAPKARIRLPATGVLVVKGLAFGSAAFAIQAVGRHRLAALFALVSVVNTLVAAVDRDATFRARRG